MQASDESHRKLAWLDVCTHACYKNKDISKAEFERLRSAYFHVTDTNNFSKERLAPYYKKYTHNKTFMNSPPCHDLKKALSDYNAIMAYRAQQPQQPTYNPSMPMGGMQRYGITCMGDSDYMYCF